MKKTGSLTLRLSVSENVEEASAIFAIAELRKLIKMYTFSCSCKN